MTNPITWAKDYFSHIDKRSWHYQVVRKIWYKNKYRGAWRQENQKACSYYWWRVPSAVVLFGVGIVFKQIIQVVLWFFGTGITPKDDFLPYKKRLDGTKVRVAPWEVVTPLVVLWLLYYLAIVDPSFGRIVLLSIGVVGGVGAVVFGFFYVVGRLHIPDRASAAWDAICPDAVFVDKKPTAVETPAVAEGPAIEEPEAGDVIGPVP